MGVGGSSPPGTTENNQERRDDIEFIRKARAWWDDTVRWRWRLKVRKRLMRTLPLMVRDCEKRYGEMTDLGAVKNFSGKTWRFFRFGPHLVVIEGVWYATCRCNRADIDWGVWQMPDYSRANEGT